MFLESLPRCLNINNKCKKIINSPAAAKADTGASKHTSRKNTCSTLQNVKTLNAGPKVYQTNNESLQASHNGMLPLNNYLSNTAKEAYVFPTVTTKSLVSVGQLCDDNCIAVFDKNNYQSTKITT